MATPWQLSQFVLTVDQINDYDRMTKIDAVQALADVRLEMATRDEWARDLTFGVFAWKEFVTSHPEAELIIGMGIWRPFMAVRRGGC